MENCLIINGKRIDLTEDQVKLIMDGRETSVKLAEISAGETCKIGSHEMIVLEQLDGATVLIRKDMYGDPMEFGTNNCYTDSYVDCTCETFACEIGEIIGADNIIEYTVDLTSDDGLKDYGTIERRASLLTTEQYRKYVQILDKYKIDAYWWLATPYSTATHGNTSWVKCVSPAGIMNYYFYDDDFGVRPFCILKSNIFVSK